MGSTFWIYNSNPIRHVATTLHCVATPVHPSIQPALVMDGTTSRVRWTPIFLSEALVSWVGHARFLPGVTASGECRFALNQIPKLPWKFFFDVSIFDTGVSITLYNSSVARSLQEFSFITIYVRDMINAVVEKKVWYFWKYPQAKSFMNIARKYDHVEVFKRNLCSCDIPVLPSSECSPSRNLTAYLSVHITWY